MNQYEFILVADGNAYGLVQEHQGWIFRNISAPAFACNGHHPTSSKAVLSVLQYGVVVNKRNKVVTEKYFKVKS